MKAMYISQCYNETGHRNRFEIHYVIRWRRTNTGRGEDTSGVVPLMGRRGWLIKENGAAGSLVQG